MTDTSRKAATRRASSSDSNRAKSAAPVAQPVTQPPASADIVRRRSRIHGAGVFAIRPIAKGTRIIEYTGDRITQAEADRRYEDRPYDDNHTFLFQVDDRLVVDGGVGGSLARFINHSCDGNCEVEIDRRRIFIEAIRPIAPGDELTYDYSLVRTPEDPPDLDEVFACRCGSPKCRGSMLSAEKPAKVAPKKKAAPAKKKAAPAKKKAAPAKKKAAPAKKKAAPAKKKAARRT